MIRKHRNTSLIRLNLDEAIVPAGFGKRTVGINVTKVGEYEAPIIEITGTGHIYSKAEYVIAPDDEHKYGFVIG